MNVEYTGRHYEVTPANRKDVETGLTKIRKILRNKFDTKVILALEKRRHNGKNGKWNGEAEREPATRAVAAGASGASGAAPTASMVVHKFPAVAKSTEVHLVRTDQAVALRPMTLEEAIKEAHFRDRDVFVFRDPKGKVMVLHRTRDGKMELIEAP